MHADIHTQTQTQTHKFINTLTQTHTHNCSFSHPQTHTHTQTPAHTHTRTHTYTRTHTHTHTHTHTQNTLNGHTVRTLYRTSHTNSLPCLVTAARWVRPVATCTTWVSGDGRGSRVGSDSPPPQPHRETHKEVNNLTAVPSVACLSLTTREICVHLEFTSTGTLPVDTHVALVLSLIHI